MSGPTSNQLKFRAAFLEPQLGSDPDGNPISGYVEQFRLWTGMLPLRGSEAVMQARMQSKTPAILTVRSSSLSRRITSDWKVQVMGRKFDVKEEPRETSCGAFFEMLVEAR